MRLKKLRKVLSRAGKFPYFISSLINIKYLTGFSGSYAYLLIDDEKIFLISDSRYEEYATGILPKNVEFVLQDKELVDALKKILKKNGRKELYLEEHSLTFSNFLLIKNGIKGIRLLPGGDEVNYIRIQKDKDELSQIKNAARITDRCFKHLLGMIKPGIMEWDVSVEIDYFYRRNGCTKTSFDSIVASGKGSSMPHYSTSMTKSLKSGDILLIDMGCVYNGYNSDLTRTIFLHSIDDEFNAIYNTVLNAQKRAVMSVKPGVFTGTVDRAARDYISDAGYGEAFGHSLGHGVGLDVHELPAVKSDGNFRLKKDMVITIEPGIYIPDTGGIRIEDMVVVTGKGCEFLTKSPKEIVILQ